MAFGTQEPPSVKDTTIKAILKLIPNVGESLCVIFEDTHKRYSHRGAEAVGEIATLAGRERLSKALSSSEEVEVLFIQGVEVAMRTGMAAKRRMMARVVSKAVEDEAG